MGKCEFEGLIDDVQLNGIIDSYLGARRLAELPGFTQQAQEMLRNSGLTENPDLLVEFDLIIQKALRVHIEKERRKKKPPSTGKGKRR